VLTPCVSSCIQLPRSSMTSTHMIYKYVLWLFLCSILCSYVAAGSKNTGKRNHHAVVSRQMKTIPTAFCAASNPAPATRRSSSPIPPPPPISMPVWSLACPAISLPSSPITETNGTSESPVETTATTEATPKTSMNIVTFATAVSVAAPKLWAVSLYHNTLTKDSFLASGSGVLQLLSSSSKSSSSTNTSNQKYLVPVLGKRSGYDDTASTGTYLSKKDESGKLGFGWIRPNPDDFACPADLELLPECCTYISLRLQQIIPAGDHVVALCEVIDTGVWNQATKTVVSCANVVDAPQVFDPSSALYTGQLREEGII
jgi:flavin reductase (DIM6/NTAB) family NADH-FMN oxidoreductase RutF